MTTSGIIGVSAARRQKEATHMAEIPQDVKKHLFMVKPRTEVMMSCVAEVLAFVCLVVGIVADIMSRSLLLEPLSWFLLAVAFFVYGLWAWLAAYFGAKEG